MYGPGSFTVTDLGDVEEILYRELRVKGRAHLSMVWHIGTVSEAPAGSAGPPPPPSPPRKVDLVMDLGADKQVALAIGWTDELGNPTGPPPSGAAAVFTVDVPAIVALTDNGDGTAVAAATGTLGPAVVHVEVTSPEFAAPLTGDLLLNVVPGLAERVEIRAGAPTEVTPDL